MSDFKVVEIIDANTFRVEPSWQLSLNEGSNFIGDRIFIRGMGVNNNDSDAKLRLKKSF